MDLDLVRLLNRPTLDVAKGLIGVELGTCSSQGISSGIIIEVEAYGANAEDRACHAHRGQTPRNEVMFQAPGHCYVYLIYGLHFCVNVVTEPKGTGAAVLIRALEPLQGVELMQIRRNLNSVDALCSGPAKLCQALGINREHNGRHLLSSNTVFLKRTNLNIPKGSIKSSKRIGITKSCELKWRYLLVEHLNSLRVRVSTLPGATPHLIKARNVRTIRDLNLQWVGQGLEFS